MKRTKIKEVLNTDLLDQTITVCGWVRTVREQKSFSFVEINDGSCFSSLQVLVEGTLPKEVTTGASVSILGVVQTSPGKGQKQELKALEVRVLGDCPPEEYPLQKKRHSFEFLRTIAHLRPRTNTQGAVARIRNACADATHRFFQERGFIYLQTPIITGSDCEGAGELFQVTTLKLDKLNPSQSSLDYSKDFFGKPAYLTVSGQLNAESMACALSDVYTFGPTFRAENSNTSRHLAEFWMIEPEMAFADLKTDRECAESFLKYIIQAVLDRCPEDMEFFDQFIEKGVIDRLRHVAGSPFAHLTYTEAVEILEKANRSFEFPVHWGIDLQSEHERYLAEVHCKGPLILTDYPKKIKAFYMRDNDDGKTVAAMDVLVPKIGEIIGGSQREERLDRLEQKILEHGIDPKELWWYLELRKYGSVPHAGFGAGFERLVLFITGLENIRDAIAFPRYPGHADF
jgi:asparaginyl-tRNA synthetase